MSNMDPTGQYLQMIAALPRKKKQQDQDYMTKQLSYAKALEGFLGFDPMNYNPSTEVAFQPKESVVRLTYGNDPIISATLDDIDAGHETSSSVAAKLIDPATEDVAPAAADKGITLAQAKTAVKAAADYEKERATTTADQHLYESRQQADPGFGRTKGDKPVLGEGRLDQGATPEFAYSQELLDRVLGMDTKKPLVQQYSDPIGPLPPDVMQPQQHVGKVFPAGDATSSVASLFDVQASQGKPKAGKPQYTQRGNMPSRVIANARSSQSPQERTAGTLTSIQKFVQNKMNSGPQVASPAQKAAAQRLMQLQALLGG